MVKSLRQEMEMLNKLTWDVNRRKSCIAQLDEKGERDGLTKQKQDRDANDARKRLNDIQV